MEPVQVVEVPPPDEVGLFQNAIPIGWRDWAYHCARRWLAVFLPMSLLVFVLLFWSRCERPRRRQRCTIAGATLPSREEFDAVCSAPGQSARLVYLQVKDDMFVQYQALCKAMNGYYSSSSKGVVPGGIQPGECCAVQPAVGADWKRARVLGRHEGVMEVCFVDTGATMEISSKQGRELIEEFCVLPAMAVQCQLENSNGSGSVTAGKHVTVVVLDRSTGPPLVRIKNQYIASPKTPMKRRLLYVAPSPSQDQVDGVYHLQETQITQGKYFLRGGTLCHVTLEWTEEGVKGEEEGEEVGGCKEVAVVGDFTDGKQVPLELVSNGVFRHTFCLPIAQYEFFFMVDGQRTHNPSLPTKLNQADEVVNYLAIEPLERRSEVQLKVTSAAGQRAVVVIPEDNSVEGQNMSVVADEGATSIHVEFSREQQVVNSNERNN